jgi:3-hydroxyacyl-[acyl-carrier-protein] dehydratase
MSDVITPQQIEKILPHRYPFLMVDRVIHINLETNEIIGLKNLTVNEHFFQGHFPGAPVMPGVLILEAIAQTGGILVHEKGYGNGRIAVLSTVTNAKFRRPVTPGDTLLLHVKGKVITATGGKVEAKAMVGEQLMAECELSFVMVNREKL